MTLAAHEKSFCKVLLFSIVILAMVLCLNSPAVAQEATAQEEKPTVQTRPEESPTQQETLAPPTPTAPPAQPTPPISAPAQPEKREEETLKLDEPALAPPPKGEAPSLGPFSNINIGGLLDYRYIPGPRTVSTGSAFLVIHVNELFISTNIGENISILAEQLLITSGRESEVGQDHGFVFATFTNLPFLPSELSFRIGRFRFRYGIDAVSDSAINPVRTLPYKSIGFIADRGLELSGYWRWFDLSAAVLNGPDEKVIDIPNTPAQARVGSGNKNRPLALRLGINIPEGPQMGFSYFDGKSNPVLNLRGFDPDTMIFNATLKEDTLILKRRYSVDAKYSIWRLDFAGELTLGTDKFVGIERDVEGYYFRTDVTILPRKFKWLFQYDLWRDDDPTSIDDGALSTAATVNITEESLMRAAYLLNLGDLGTYALILQLLLAF